MLYDGQGSVRHHSDSSGALVSYNYDTDLWCDTFSYDAYGHRIDPLADMVNEGLFYTGEQWDNSAQSYYLRARYYNPLNVRFNRVDPFAGNMQDPQSLHKYLYVHCNPINNIDPTGEFSLTGVITSISIGITAMSLGFKAYRIGMGFRSLIFLSDLAIRLAKTPLNIINQILIRNHMYQLAVAIIGDMAQTFASIISEVLLDIGIAIAAVVLIASVSGIMKATVGSVSVKLSKFINARKMAKVRRLGQVGEDAAGIVARKESIPSLTGKATRRLPDELTTVHLREVKNRAYVWLDPQIKDFLEFSKARNLDFILDVRKTTKLSKPLLKLEEAGVIIIRRYL